MLTTGFVVAMSGYVALDARGDLSITCSIGALRDPLETVRELPVTGERW